MNTEELRRQDDYMMEHLENRLDEHIRIYSENGKEMARLAHAVETMFKSVEERNKVVDEMFEVYQSFKFGKKGLFWFIGTFTFIGGALLLGKQLFK